MQPYEVIAAPYVCYLAPTTLTGPVGGFPNLDTAPPAPWTLVGTAGSKSYVNTGVTVSHTQTLGTFVPAGSPAVRKAWRQTEELTISFSIADMSPAQYALQLNNAAVVSQAASGGAPGDQHFEFYGGEVFERDGGLGNQRLACGLEGLRDAHGVHDHIVRFGNG